MSGTVPELAPLDRSTLVEASAGTGKTHTITTYFVRAIVEDGYAPKEILVVTYTKAATAELRARARGRILDALTRMTGPSEHHDDLDEVLSTAAAKLGADQVEFVVFEHLDIRDPKPAVPEQALPRQGEMPAGVVTALIGAPLFIYLLKRAK